MIKSFPPISDKNSKILILGTMPSVKSLEENQYYAHKGNQFWKIMFDIFNESFSLDYNVRRKLLIDNNIALWDVLKACIREGSSDGAITKQECNDFKSFLGKHPLVRTICFNGNNAYDYYETLVKDFFGRDHYVLPSTSPANTWLTYEKKLEVWTQKIHLKN